MRHEDRIFERRVVKLDGNEYHRCVFVDCVLAYAGGPPPVLSECTLERTGFQFTRAAADTLRWLGRLHREGYPEVVRQVVENITGAPDPD